MISTNLTMNTHNSKGLTVDIPVLTLFEESIPVTKAINEGVELRKKRNQQKSNPDQKLSKHVKPIYKEQLPKCPACFVHKIKYPETIMYKECRHGHSKVQQRHDINRTQHLKILAKPNKLREMPKQYPVMVEKKIHCATYRLAELAQPRRYHVQNTWTQFANVLDQYHIENCHKHMQPQRFTETQNAVEFFTQKKRYARFKRNQRHVEIRKLQQEIREMKRQQIRSTIMSILRDLYDFHKPFLIAKNIHLLTQKRLIISEYILVQICKFIGYSMPKRVSKALFDTFIVNLADNIAIWITIFGTNCDFDMSQDFADKTPTDISSHRESNQANKYDPSSMQSTAGLNKIPIDAFIDNSTDDVSDTDLTDSNSMSETNWEEEEEEQDAEEFTDEHD